MSEIRVGEGESIETALKRFKKKIQREGILSEIKRRERYEKPSVKRKRKSEAARDVLRHGPAGLHSLCLYLKLVSSQVIHFAQK